MQQVWPASYGLYSYGKAWGSNEYGQLGIKSDSIAHRQRNFDVDTTENQLDEQVPLAPTKPLLWPI